MLIEKQIAEKLVSALKAVLPDGFIVEGDRIAADDSRGIEGAEWERAYLNISPMVCESAEKWRQGAVDVSLDVWVRAEKDGVETDINAYEDAVVTLLFDWRFDPAALEDALGDETFSTAYIALTGGESPALNLSTKSWHFSRTFTLSGICN